MFVEIEIYEYEDGLTSYSGKVDNKTLTSLVDGKYTKPFLKLDNVHWSYMKKQENGKSEKILYIYGEGKYSNYQGCMYIRTDRIVYIHPLTKEKE